MVGKISAQATALQQVSTQSTERADGKGLLSQFADRLEKTGELLEKAETAASSMANGEAGAVETVLALSRAELALRHVVSVRNRAIESYKEVMRLPL